MTRKNVETQVARIPLFMALVLLCFVAVTASSSQGDKYFKPLRNRRMIYFGNFDGIKRCALDGSKPAPGSALVSSRRKKDEMVGTESSNADTRINNIWPPWPFNLVRKREGNFEDAISEYPSNGVLFRAYLKQRTRIIFRQIEHLSRELWFQLPPATPPLMLVALQPEKVAGSERVMPALFANRFVRNLVLTSLGLAVVSWANEKLNHRRQLEPLPLPEKFQDISRAFLPPFLPEEVELNRDLEMESGLSESNLSEMEEEDNEIEHDIDIGQFPDKVKRYIQQIYSSPPGGEIAKQLRAKHMMQQNINAKQQREDILSELLAFQKLKKRAKKRKDAKSKSERKQKLTDSSQDDELGYALVTGASRGIGRSLAVELARWEIPLILVARDKKKLIELATDIKKCYGVKCCVLTADLSNPDAAKNIHKTTSAAGLKVDILVNNAGLSSSGEFVDMEEDTLRNMMQVNAISAATLSHLYGRDMKRRRRGRILLVSSVVGAVPAGPTIAAYAATKAFEKSLGLSIAKELELYGVGVTCLLPGAVAETSFGKTSGMSQEALCWQIPFYAKSSKTVASEGVRALLEGNTKAIPGWQNRGLIKVFMPFLPERAITWIVEAAFNPISYWWGPKFTRSGLQEEGPRGTERKEIPRARNKHETPPAFLNIQEDLNTEKSLDEKPGAILCHEPELLDREEISVFPQDNNDVNITNLTNASAENALEYPLDIQEEITVNTQIIPERNNSEYNSEYKSCNLRNENVTKTAENNTQIKLEKPKLDFKAGPSDSRYLTLELGENLDEPSDF